MDQRIQIRQELDEGDQRAGAVVSLQLIFIPTRRFFKFKICVENWKNEKNIGMESSIFFFFFFFGLEFRLSRFNRC